MGSKAPTLARVQRIAIASSALALLSTVAVANAAQQRTPKAAPLSKESHSLHAGADGLRARATPVSTLSSRKNAHSELDAAPPFEAGAVSADCTFNGKRLAGNVKVVTSSADVKVKVVTSFPDLNVKVVESFPDNCGQWRFVESFPDFTIQYVESFPDVKIRMVESFPGVP